MAPGNMKSDIIGPQRMKIDGRQGLLRKNMSRNSAVLGEMPSSVQHSNHSDNNTNSKAFTQDISNLKELCVAKGTPKSTNDRSLYDDEERTRMESQIKHLKELLLLHLDIIQQQQEQLLAKDRENKNLRSEKETLKCRLERMERRMSLAHKSGSSQESGSPSSRQHKLTQTQVHKRRLSEDSSSSPASKKSGLFPRTPSQKISEFLKSSTKLKADLHKKSEKLKDKEEKCFRTSLHYFSHNRVPPMLLNPIHIEDSNVLLPAWRINVIPSSTSVDGIEDISDDTFTKRHLKYEVDERKRKRWDIQRIRELRQHDLLERKVLKREQLSVQVLTTFKPSIHEAECIEVHDLLPVTAFGKPLPPLQQKHFELPWFDLKEREKEEKPRQTRRWTKK
ncbi:male-specific lethal 1-like 1 [Saccoglossus kowalevskii]|uniref:Male-specific lethal 1-like 1-like n=1 Tax=Saccoglossus kowalevskii TaxID=10224 RepID=A0ABM0GW89_SACKO|nr:PREDICTED: male-specific lethal 1-like 1-like [Saccoglossus kowalevskii]